MNYREDSTAVQQTSGTTGFHITLIRECCSKRQIFLCQQRNDLCCCFDNNTAFPFRSILVHVPKHVANILPCKLYIYI